MLFFKVSNRTMPIGKDKGKTKYFAQREARGVMTLRQVEEEIVQKTSLAKGDVRNAVASLAEVVNGALLSGLKVDLGDLGSFSVEANGRYVSTEGEVNANTIRKPQIRYNPKTEMRVQAQKVPISVHNPKDKTGSGASSGASAGSGSGSGASGGDTSGPVTGGGSGGLL